MAVRGTAESHSPGATGLRFCARGCGPKPVRFFNSHTSRCSLLGRAVEENGCALNRRESLSSRNWLEVLCLRGADQNLSAFSIRIHPVAVCSAERSRQIAARLTAQRPFPPAIG